MRIFTWARHLCKFVSCRATQEIRAKEFDQHMIPRLECDLHAFYTTDHLKMGDFLANIEGSFWNDDERDGKSQMMSQTAQQLIGGVWLESPTRKRAFASRGCTGLHCCSMNTISDFIMLPEFSSLRGYRNCYSVVFVFLTCIIFSVATNLPDVL